MKTCLCIVPALAVIIFINSHRSSLFGTAKYQLVAEQLLAGQTYYGDIDFDERAFQKLMAQRLPRNLTTLVAGSSRTMQLSYTCFNEPYYNASVSGAMLSDVTAIIEEFRRGRDLTHVIVAADPWMLSEHEQSAAWNTAPSVPNLIRIQAAPDWIRGQLRLGLTPHPEDFVAAARATLEPLRELLDPATLQASLHPSPTKTGARFRYDVFRKTPRGDLIYPYPYSRTQDTDILRVADQHLSQTYAGFNRIDPFLAHAFEALTQDLKNHNIRVTLVLAPFHPIYYRHVGKIMQMTEAYYRSLNLETIGSYNPARLGPYDRDFLDAVHLNRLSLMHLYGCGPDLRPVIE